MSSFEEEQRLRAEDHELTTKADKRANDLQRLIDELHTTVEQMRPHPPPSSVGHAYFSPLWGHAHRSLSGARSCCICTCIMDSTRHALLVAYLEKLDQFKIYSSTYRICLCVSTCICSIHVLYILTRKIGFMYVR